MNYIQEIYYDKEMNYGKINTLTQSNELKHKNENKALKSFIFCL